MRSLNIIVALNHEVSRGIANSISSNYLKMLAFDKSICLPQVELTETVGLERGHFEIILTRSEYQQFIEKYTNTGKFENWLNLVFEKNTSALISLRSSFLEQSSKNDLILIKQALQKQKYSKIKFIIILDDLKDLLMRRFLSARYQIESKFSNKNLNCFYENRFKKQILQSVGCIERIIDLFGIENVNFMYKTEHTNPKFDQCFSEKFSKLCNIQFPVFDSVKIGEYDLNSIFFNYLNKSIEDKEVDIRKEILELKKLSIKYNLQTKNSINELNPIHLKEIKKMENKLFLISKINSPKKILSIEHNRLKSEIEYIENNSLL